MIRSTCPYCGVGCGVLLTPDGAGGLSVKGDPDHPANRGRLCSKGSALGETVGLDGRLLAPRVFGQTVDWQTALGTVADRFSQVIAEHGPEAVAFYVSGQLLTEDYYVANKLMKGFIGTANIDTNSRLCMASSVAGHMRAFGSDTVPGLYEDLELADLVVLTGSNLAWCHPVLYQRLAAAKAARPEMRVVVIDPRRTATCDLADLHLAVSPGGDVALFNALLVGLVNRGAIDTAFVGQHVNGLDAAVLAARDGLAGHGISNTDLAQFIDFWAATKKVVTVYSQGVNQSANGTDKVNAIINCHLATGRIGQPGKGPFSVTGQPNAMGGREVGGLATMLACHLGFDKPAHRTAVQTFWRSPAIAAKPGLKAVDMFKAVADGRIRAIWIIHTNPVVSMPDANAVRAALMACPFVVVSDVTDQTDTAACADVLLPATAWAEKDGTVTNSDRTISRQRAALAIPGQARADWQILAGVAQKMGWHDAFCWQSSAEIFQEYAALSGVAGGLGSDFDISDYADLTDADYAGMTPFTWPQNGRKQGGRFFGDGQFHTVDGRAIMLPVAPVPMQAVAPDYPFRLNTGRIRDQWHTMTRSAKSPRLSQHLAEPFMEIHPEDAALLNIAPAELVRVHNAFGSAVLRAWINPTVQQGQIFAPMHWTDQNAAAARIDALVPAVVDPVSGQPDSKATAVAVNRFDAAWYGFAVTTGDATLTSDYWARARVAGGWRIELADRTAVVDWIDYARRLFGLHDMPTASVIDQKKGVARVAFHQGDKLIAALFTSRIPVAVSRAHVAGLIGATVTPDALAGRPSADVDDPGATVCACLNVGFNTICAAVETGQAKSVEQLGQLLGAGTSCGSCRPELSILINRFRAKEAAE